MDKESIYLLQKVDCNCNDCKFMERDFETFNKWKKIDENLQISLFNMKKAMAIENAKALPEHKRENALKLANKMTFKLQGNPCPIQYGKCQLFASDVSFLPNICQLNTQVCFLHRKD